MARPEAASRRIRLAMCKGYSRCHDLLLFLHNGLFNNTQWTLGPNSSRTRHMCSPFGPQWIKWSNKFTTGLFLILQASDL